MRRRLEQSGYRAITKYLIVSPFKIRPVATLIRRKPYPEAIALLENMPQRGARILRKTVKSAASNALNKNKQLEEDMLYIREVLIDEGPRMKRVWFRARGRADTLLKRLCHITVIVDETGMNRDADKTGWNSSEKAGK
jgi:large subunit ribosomal protein L22